MWWNWLWDLDTNLSLTAIRIRCACACNVHLARCGRSWAAAPSVLDYGQVGEQAASNRPASDSVPRTPPAPLTPSHCPIVMCASGEQKWLGDVFALISYRQIFCKKRNLSRQINAYHNYRFEIKKTSVSPYIHTVCMQYFFVIGLLTISKRTTWAKQGWSR